MAKDKKTKETELSAAVFMRDQYAAQNSYLTDRNNGLIDQVSRLTSHVKQLEADIPAMKKKMLADQIEIASLKGYIKSVREREDAAAELVNVNGTLVPKTMLARSTVARRGTVQERRDRAISNEMAFGSAERRPEPRDWVVVGND